jgi:hypothetical protein
MQMIIKSSGFKFKDLYIPSFNLYTGEYVSLNFPGAYDPEIEEWIVNTLIGKNRLSTVTVTGVVSFVPSSFRYSFFDKLFKTKTTFTILKAEMMLPDRDIKAILDNLSIRPDQSLLELGFNEQKLLGLEIAYSKSKNIIINCSGLDYSGMAKLKERISPNLFEGSVIELNYLTSKGREYLFDDEQHFKRRIIELVKK